MVSGFNSSVFSQAVDNDLSPNSLVAPKREVVDLPALHWVVWMRQGSLCTQGNAWEKDVTTRNAI